MRTGTTVLQSVLCSSERTNKVIHECQYLAAQMALFAARFQAFSVLDESYFSSGDALMEFTTGIVCNFLALARKRYKSPKVLVLKTPELTPFFPYLMQMLPEAKFVVSVREPKDTIASMIKVGERQVRRGEPPFFQGSARDVAQFVTHYRSYYAPLFEHLNKAGASARARVMFVSYERLLTDTASTVAALGRFSGIDLGRFDKNAAWRSEVHGAAGNVEDGKISAWQTELEGGKLSMARMGRYAEVLTEQEIAQVDALSVDICRVFGYDNPHMSLGEPQDIHSGAERAAVL